MGARGGHGRDVQRGDRGLGIDLHRADRDVRLRGERQPVHRLDGVAGYLVAAKPSHRKPAQIARRRADPGEELRAATTAAELLHNAIAKPNVNSRKATAFNSARRVSPATGGGVPPAEGDPAAVGGADRRGVELVAMGDPGRQQLLAIGAISPEWLTLHAAELGEK